MSLYYAGIGSRTAPAAVLALCTEAARILDRVGFTLRTGGAEGTDQAFMAGTNRREIFVPKPHWHGLTDGLLLAPAVQAEAEGIAAAIHPAWHLCNAFARACHARNVAQVLGADLATPVQFVLFWAPEVLGRVQGGTATAVHLARARNIPTINLSAPGAMAFVTGWEVPFFAE